MIIFGLDFWTRYVKNDNLSRIHPMPTVPVFGRRLSRLSRMFMQNFLSKYVIENLRFGLTSG